MGGTPLEIEETLREIVHLRKLEFSHNQVVNNHIRWIDEFKERKEEKNIQRKIPSYKGREFSLSSFPTMDDLTGIDFLRLKAKKNVRKELYSLTKLPKILIIDYNSSSSQEALKEDILRIQKKCPNTKLYLEQPYPSERELGRRFGKERYIYDAINPLAYFRSSLYRPEDVFCLKLGRNTPEEYHELFQNGANVYFGNVTSTKLADNILTEVNSLFSTILFSLVE